MGPAKLQKAEKLGIKIITEQELVDMIGENSAEQAEISDSTTQEHRREEPLQGVLF